MCVCQVNMFICTRINKLKDKAILKIYGEQQKCARKKMCIIQTYKHTYICTYVHTYLCTYMCMCIYGIYICMCLCIYICMYLYSAINNSTKQKTIKLHTTRVLQKCKQKEQEKTAKHTQTPMYVHTNRHTYICMYAFCAGKCVRTIHRFLIRQCERVRERQDLAESQGLVQLAKSTA